ncbi:MAG: cytochrome c-type biogenesis protein CcmH [Chloroflexi bacterium]|nr:cytochrome c-type biogenesis protein CcmH [Chloroflexota bacterium]
MKRNALWLSAVLLVLTAIALASLLSDHSSSIAPTPAQRARLIEEQLACPICQGETVADSPSVLAIEMRHIIEQQVKEGWTDTQIRQYFVARYGPGILLNPPKRGITLGIWLVPLVVLAVSLFGISFAAVRWVHAASDDPNDPDALMTEVRLQSPIPTGRSTASDSEKINSSDSSGATHMPAHDGGAHR